MILIQERAITYPMDVFIRMYPMDAFVKERWKTTQRLRVRGSDNA